MTKPIGCALVCTVWIGIAAVAAGQEEQWLQYRTSPQTSELIGGTYGQRQTPTEKPPDGVELPEFTGDTPLFASWRSRLAKGGIVQVALDSSKA